MKKMLILLFLSISLNSFCQKNNSTPQFIEFVVNGETSPELLKKINFEFQSNSEFQATRMDIPTERFFGVYKVGKSVDLDWFRKKFKSFGLTIHCINTGLVGDKPYQHLSRKDCPEINNQ